MVLGVCGGYQLLGHRYEIGDERLPGVGLVDLRTVRADGPRLIGNVAIEVDLGRRPARAGRLREPRRAHAPGRGRAAAGTGAERPRQQRADGVEGVRRGSVIGTYLHGPLLPKNAWFADWLIATAHPGWRASSRSTTRWRTRRTRARGARPASPDCGARSAARRAETAVAAIGSRQRGGLDRFGQRHRNDDELSDAVAGLDPECRFAIGVQQQHLELAAIALVDQPRCVDERDSMTRRESRARQHEPGVPARQLDRESRPYPCALTGPDRSRLERAEVETGVAGVGALREDGARVEALDRKLHGARA